MIVPVIPSRGLTLQQLLKYFDAWLKQPIRLTASGVRDSMETLCRHPLFQDETYCDEPDFREFDRGEAKGFEIYIENQGVTSFYVLNEHVSKLDSPVYFYSSIGLDAYCDDASFRVGKDSMIACSSFQEFLWQCIAQYICCREHAGDALSDTVCGEHFESEFELDNTFRPNHRFCVPVCTNATLTET